MRIPGLSKRTAEPVVTLTPLQELLAAENAVSLAQGEIDALNREYQDWQRHWGVIEDTDGQFRGILNESLLSEEVTEAHLRQQFRDFKSRKNVLLRNFHEKLAAWAELKQRYAQAIEQVNALPMLAPPA
jgi:hypothetical protein